MHFRSSHGFTLFEAILSVAAFALVGILAMNIFDRSLITNQRAKAHLMAREVARAHLEEYLALFPNAEESGIEQGRWEWQIENRLLREVSLGQRNEIVETTIAVDDVLTGRSAVLVLTRIRKATSK